MNSKNSSKLNKSEKQMKNGYIAVLCVLALLLGIASTSLYYHSNPVTIEKEVPVVVNNTIVENYVEVIGLDKLDQLYKETYSAEYNAIETRTYQLVEGEISEKDIEKYLTENIAKFDEVKDYDFPGQDEASVKIDVIKLGLENEEDKVANFNIEIPVKYKLTAGTDVKYLATLVVNGTIAYEEGDLQDETIELNYFLQK